MRKHNATMELFHYPLNLSTCLHQNSGWGNPLEDVSLPDYFFQKIPNCVSPHWTESTWRPLLSCIEIVLLKSELIEEAHEKCRRQAEDE